MLSDAMIPGLGCKVQQALMRHGLCVRRNVSPRAIERGGQAQARARAQETPGTPSPTHKRTAGSTPADSSVPLIPQCGPLKQPYAVLLLTPLSPVQDYLLHA